MTGCPSTLRIGGEFDAPRERTCADAGIDARYWQAPATVESRYNVRGNAMEGHDHARDVRLRRAREAAVGAYQRPNRAPRARGQAWNDRVVENQGGRACRCASASARADRLDAQGQDG